MATTIIDGLHLFKVASYSLSKGLGYGKYISSEAFEIGGHSWEVRFYPDGKREDDNATYVSVFVVLASEGPAKALFELTLLDQSGRENHMVKPSFEAYTLVTEGSMWGYKQFIKRTDLEASDYLRDDCLQISCRVGVVRSQTDETF